MRPETTEKRPNRSILLITLLAALGCTSQDVDRANPLVENILLISIDTLRQDYLGCYNPAVQTTPNIDRFAQDSVLFADALSQGASTAISHKSIFYSLYPAIHKMRIRQVPHEDIVSPLESLQQADLRTAAFVGGGQLRPKFGFNKGFDSYVVIKKTQEEPLEKLESAALNWLESNGSSPFFLFLHTYQVHTPYDPPEPYRGDFTDWYDGDVETGLKKRKGLRAGKAAEADLQLVRDLYAAEVAYTDHFLGDLFAGLKRLGLYDKTMIIFISDHGQSLGEQDYWGHNMLFEEQLEIPLLVRVPGIPAKRIDGPIEAIDVMPTIFSALDLSPPYEFQGTDLLPFMLNRESGPKGRIRISQQASSVLVRDDQHSLFFDLSGDNYASLRRRYADLGTVWNGTGNPPKDVAHLWSHFKQVLVDASDLERRFVVSKATDPTRDEDVFKELRALGYLN